MENIHGVDVSWLHRPTNDHNALDRTPSGPSTPSPHHPRSEQLPPPPTQPPPPQTHTTPQASTPTEHRDARPGDKVARAAVEEVAAPTVAQPAVTVTQPMAVPKASSNTSSKRPGILSRSTSERTSTSPSSHDGKGGSSFGSFGRKGSWMSSLGLKLSQKSSSSSQSAKAQDAPAAVQATPAAAAAPPPAAPTSTLAVPDSAAVVADRDSSARNSSEHVFEEEDAAPSHTASASPKQGQSFFSSALRRLSSNSVTAALVPDAQPPASAQTERRVLNVDRERERCDVEGLSQSRLRRVAFSVDVEVAGCSRYIEDSAEDLVDKLSPQEKRKDKKVKERSEGDALKHPEVAKDAGAGEPSTATTANATAAAAAAADPATRAKDGTSAGTSSKDKEDFVVRINGKVLDDFPSPYGRMAGNAKSAVDNSQYLASSTSRKAPKKRFSKAKPAVQQVPPPQAVGQDGGAPSPREADSRGRSRSNSEMSANDKTTDPAVATAPPTSTSSATAAVASAAAPTTPSTAPKPQDKPTTDPLRVYRRCCQLREAPVLKRISEQLGNPANYAPDAPAVVLCLNLNHSRLQLPDIVALGDFFAVVPVKKVLFDDANLTDEGVRLVLAGLLASKPPSMIRRKRGRSSPTRLRDSTITRSPGVVEKLTFRANKKLTAEAWRHICLFLNLSKSIEAVDFSTVPFPKFSPPPPPKRNSDAGATDEDEAAEAGAAAAAATARDPDDIAALLCESLAKRLGGDTLEELTFADCGLSDHQVAKIAEGAAQMRLRRLGLAGNRVSRQGLRSIVHYLLSGHCKGIDLGGVNMHGNVPLILEAMVDTSPLHFLSFANSNLDAVELRPLMERVATLPDLRFIDLSHNRKLFAEGQTVKALHVVREALPRMKMMKRVHLLDVSMSPADAIGIAEVVPEMRNLAHLNILENPQLAAVASATDAASSEEACALYASLMTAVRLSKTLVCVDVDVPSKEASEVVRALARQVVAYCLRNLELFAQGDALRVADAAAALPDVSPANTDMLVDVVGRAEDGADVDALPVSAKNEDFLVGGQGWVKALSHCLDARSLHRMSASGKSTPSEIIESDGGKAQAKEMSKELLANARNFRQRLQAVLAREESQSTEYEVMRRLQFLDSTIKSIIERFESEYPECRTARSESKSTEPATPPEPVTPEAEAIDLTSPPIVGAASSSDNEQDPFAGFRRALANVDGGKEGDADGTGRPSSFARRGSATDIASFALASEEAKFHRFGQRFRRDLLPPRGTDDALHGTRSDDPVEPEYDLELRRMLEGIGGDDIRRRVNEVGYEMVLREWKESRERFKLKGASVDANDENAIDGAAADAPTTSTGPVNSA